MKLFLITFNNADYDYHDGFVIIAKNKNEAIQYLKGKYLKELGGVQWSKGYKIKEIRPRDYKEITVILESYIAG